MSKEQRLVEDGERHFSIETLLERMGEVPDATMRDSITAYLQVLREISIKVKGVTLESFGGMKAKLLPLGTRIKYTGKGPLRDELGTVTGYYMSHHLPYYLVTYDFDQREHTANSKCLVQSRGPNPP